MKKKAIALLLVCAMMIASVPAYAISDAPVSEPAEIALSAKEPDADIPDDAAEEPDAGIPDDAAEEPDAAIPDDSAEEPDAAFPDEAAESDAAIPDGAAVKPAAKPEDDSGKGEPAPSDIITAAPAPDAVAAISEAQAAGLQDNPGYEVIANLTAEITEAGGVHYYNWTPQRSGTYIFESVVPSGSSPSDTYGTLYDSDWKVLASNDDGGNGLNFSISHYFVADTKYYFGVRWYSSSATGSMDLELKHVMNATPLSASDALTQSGATATANIEGAGDIIYYSITPASSGTYVFESTLSSGDSYGYLYDSGWEQLDYNDDGGSGNNFQISYDLTAGSTYYYGVRWYSPSMTGSIPVTLRRNRVVTELDPAAATSSGGATAAANITSGGEIVYYSITPARSGTYTFESTLSSGDSCGILYDSEWEELESNDDGGENLNFRITRDLTAGTLYYFGVRWLASSVTGLIPVKLSLPVTITPLDAAAARTQSGATATASITNAGDIAYFSFTPTTSGSYLFESTIPGSSSPRDTYGYLYSEDWTELAHDDDSGDGLNFRITYSLTANATYYYGVRWYASSTTGDISVRLHTDRVVTPLTAGRYTATTATATVEAGDIAYYSFVPPESDTWILESTNTSGDPRAWLYDENWNQLGSNDDGAGYPNFLLSYGMTAGTTYYYGVNWYSATASGDISFRLYRENPYPAIDANAAATETGTSFDAEIATADEESIYSFVPVTTGRYIFESTIPSDISPRDTLGYLRDADMSQLAADDDGGDSLNFRIAYDLTAGNTYYLGARWLSPSVTGMISLRVYLVPPFTALDPAAAATASGTTANANIVSAGQTVTFSFTPQTSGTYVFESTIPGSISPCDTCASLYNADMTRLTYNDDGGNSLNFRIDYDLEAGKTYYYGVRWYSALVTGTFPVHLYLENQYKVLDPTAASTTAGAAGTANIDNAGDVDYFAFTPSASGTYVFESTLSSGDAYGHLYRANWEELAHDDDSGSGLNFRITQTLEANQTYYYGVRWYSSSTTGNIDVRLRRGFTVTLNANGGSIGSASGSRVVYNGETYGSLPRPTRGNDTFDGWYTAQTGGTLVTADSTVSLRGDQTLYAHWNTASSVVVTFNANGGTVSPRSRSVTAGGTYGELPTPARTGYRFTGWYTAAEGGTRVSSNTRVTNSAAHSLYAHWETNAVSPTSVRVSVQNSTIVVGGTTTASATVLPSNAANRTVTWRSSDTGKATVNANGVVTGVSAGTVTITATCSANSSISGSATVTVTASGSRSFYPDFIYSFYNMESSFSTDSESDYRIPAERYMQLGYPQLVADSMVENWRGSCFGMTASAILFYEDVLREARYSTTATVPHDFSAPNTNEAYATRLRSMIELLQISQTMPDTAPRYNQPSFNAAAIVSELDAGHPVKLGIRSSEGGHAVVIYNYTRNSNGYHFDIYDNAGYINGLTSTTSGNTFDYSNSRSPVWYVKNYCTYSSLRAIYDQIKSANYHNAASLLDGSDQSYTYLFCPAGNLTLTDSRGQSATVENGEVSGTLADRIEVVLSDYQEGLEPRYIIIMPSDTYTISGLSSLTLAGDTISVSVEAERPVTVSADLRRVDIASQSGDEYRVSYTTYDTSLFDSIAVSGEAGGPVSAALYVDPDTGVSERVDVTGANTVGAAASVSGKTATISSDASMAMKAVSVSWLETAGGDTALQIGLTASFNLIKSGVDYVAPKDSVFSERVQLDAPVFSLPEGEYQGGQLLVFEKDADTLIYYTLDGSEPAERTGTLYTAPIDVNRTMTVRAIAVKHGYRDSEIVERHYALPAVSTPGATLAEGRYEGPQYVDLLSDEGTSVYYTTDGSDPFYFGTLFGSSIAISSTTTLRAIAVTENGCASEEVTYEYFLLDDTGENRLALRSGVTPTVNGSSIRADLLNRDGFVVIVAVDKTGDTPITGKVIVAFYNQNGQLIRTGILTRSVSTPETPETPETFNVSINGNASGAATMKVFLLDENDRPLCAAEEYNLLR